MIGVNEYTAGAMLCLAGFAALEWLGRRSCRCRACRPKPEPPAIHVTPTQVRILRPGRELDRRGGS
jgi:hypothetical protein